MVRRMGEAGAPPEAIAIALEEIEALHTALDSRRTADRDRKRDQRERQKTAAVTGQSGDSPGTVTPRPSFDKERSPRPPKEIKSIPCVSRAREAAGYHRLPEGWEPTRSLPAATLAKVDQWPPGALADELASLHRWAANAEDKNGKGRKLNWDTAWVNWIERRHDEHYRKAGNVLSFGRPPPGSDIDAAMREIGAR